MLILPCNISDHKPIRLELSAHRNFGPIPFRFGSLWIRHPNLMDKVKESWNRLVTGSPFFVWEEKIRRVKVVLKSWAKALLNLADGRKMAYASLEKHQL